MVGGSGSGKTTVAQGLGAILDEQPTEIDNFLFEPGTWRHRSREDVEELLDPVLRQERWILDGPPRRTPQVVWDSATLIVCMEPPLPIVAWRLLRRSISRIKRRERTANGNVETWSRLFSRKSLLWRTLRFSWRCRRLVFRRVLGRRHMRLQSQQDINAFMYFVQTIIGGDHD